MTVKSDEIKKKQYSYFSEHMKNAKNRLHRKMIASESISYLIKYSTQLCLHVYLF